MLTVGQLTRLLVHLDPDLPVGAIDIDRLPGSQRVGIAMRTVVDVDLAHTADDGSPRSVWLTCVEPHRSPCTPPTIVVAKDPCGCLVPLDPTNGRSVNLDAIPCAHRRTDESTARLGRR